MVYNGLNMYPSVGDLCWVKLNVDSWKNALRLEVHYNILIVLGRSIYCGLIVVIFNIVEKLYLKTYKRPMYKTEQVIIYKVFILITY